MLGANAKPLAKQRSGNRPTQQQRQQPLSGHDNATCRETRARVNAYSDIAVGRYSRHSWQLPAAAYVPPPAVTEGGIHIQPEVSPWERLEVYGPPGPATAAVTGPTTAAVAGPATAAVPRPAAAASAADMRNQEMDNYFERFRGHPNTHAAKAAAKGNHGVRYGANHAPRHQPSHATVSERHRGGLMIDMM